MGYGDKQLELSIYSGLNSFFEAVNGGEQNSHWLSNFVKENSHLDNFDYIIHEALEEICELLLILKEIRLNLQIVEFTRKFKRNFEDFTTFNAASDDFFFSDQLFISLQKFLFLFLISNEALSNHITKKIVIFLEYFINQKHYFLKECERIELIDHEDVIKMYKELDCSKSVKVFYLYHNELIT